MTTDNRTNGQIVAKALVAHCEEHKMPFPRGSVKKIVEALRVAGRLAGEPTETQVEAAAKAIADCHNPGMFDKYPENWRVEARAALAALDGAPEPEDVWEYGYELIEPDDRNVFEREGDFISAAFAYRAARKRIHEERYPGVPSLQYAIIRRRKAGPWLPVGGEKP